LGYDKVPLGAKIVASLVVSEVLDDCAQIELDIMCFKNHFLTEQNFSRVFDKISIQAWHDSFDMNNQDILNDLSLPESSILLSA
jgi:hypothetical protein